MKNRSLLISLVAALCVNMLYGGIFDSLFGRSAPKSDVQIQQSPELVEEEEIVQDSEEIMPEEKMIVEEEVISADEYIDSTDENEDMIFESAPVVPDEQAIAGDEEAAAGTDDSDLQEVAEDPFIKVRNILLSYVQKPEKIYLRQHFRIKIKAIIPQTDITAIETQFLGGKSYQVLNRDNPWIQTGENSYENSFVFKLIDKDAKLPSIKVLNQSKSGQIQSEVLPPFFTKMVALREDEFFSRVIADSLTVKHHQERPYDEQSNIIVMEMNATHANLEDFHIPYALREGIDELKQIGDSQKVYYYAIISNMRKELKFKYFNPTEKRYDMVSFMIKPIDTSISTHTELNPQKNKYVLYKAIFLIIMSLFFVLLFIIYRKYVLLAGALVFIILLAYLQIPMTKAQLPAGSALRILPIANSTVFFRTQTPLEVDILLKKERYTKVLLPNQKIGWVKNEAIR